MMILMADLPGQVKASVILVFILCIISIILGHFIKKIDPMAKPPKYAMPLLILVGIINDFVKQNIGKRWRVYSPYFFSIAIYIFFANASSIFLLRTPTSYLMVNAGLAIISFLIIHITGVVSLGIIGYIKDLMGPVKAISFIMVPINVVSDLIFPISLSLRLTGNIISGAVISMLLTGLLGYFVIPILPVINVIFDVAFGLIQAVVFVTLSIVFTSMKVDDSEKIYA